MLLIVRFERQHDLDALGLLAPSFAVKDAHLSQLTSGVSLEACVNGIESHQKIGE